MSKVIIASCDAQGRITVGGLQVEGLVLSEGKKPSQGLLVIDKGDVFYLPSSATDIKDLISNLVAIINQVAIICAGLDAASTSPGGQTANITALQTMKNQLDQTKEALK